ncbi:MAG TPA: hypothetical protein VK210_03235 [Terriglobia bacterium]|nr:hypothetical protein [Terriglobia bacterium]
MQKKCKILGIMVKADPKEITRGLQEQAEKLFGTEHAAEIQSEIEAMGQQLATLRNTPVDLLDEP